MKYTLAALLMLSSSVTMAAGRYHDDYDNGHRESAQVTHVEPIYRTVQVSSPERECHDEPVHRSHYQQPRSYTTTIAGSIIGGVLGNQLGKGTGNTVMTAAGTLLGGSIGRDMNNKNSYYDDADSGYQQTCRVHQRYHQEQRIDGYNVTYRYQGRSYTARMNHQPGRFIPVEVSVRPKNYSNRNYY